MACNKMCISAKKLTALFSKLSSQSKNSVNIDVKIESWNSRIEYFPDYISRKCVGADVTMYDCHR